MSKWHFTRKYLSVNHTIPVVHGWSKQTSYPLDNCQMGTLNDSFHQATWPEDTSAIISLHQKFN